MPFGFCITPASFQSVMDTLKLLSSDFNEHLRRLRAVIEAIRTAGLTLKPTKCRFAYGELKFLGHNVSNACVRRFSEKTRALAAFPKLSEKKVVRRFLGFCTY